MWSYDNTNNYDKFVIRLSLVLLWHYTNQIALTNQKRERRCFNSMIHVILSFPHDSVSQMYFTVRISYFWGDSIDGCNLLPFKSPGFLSLVPLLFNLVIPGQPATNTVVSPWKKKKNLPLWFTLRNNQLIGHAGRVHMTKTCRLTVFQPTLWALQNT